MASKSKFSLPPNLPKLPEGWSWKALGELVNDERSICYGIVQPGKHDENGVQMVNSGDILDGLRGHEISFKVARSIHEKFKRSTLKGGEILLTLVGANFGNVSIAPDDYAGFNCSRPVGVIPVQSDAEYISIAMQTPLVRYYLNSWVNTTAQPTLNLSDVANLPIAWADKQARDLVVNHISGVSKKINVNTQINHTLEQMAQAIFKSWFVDFDPIKAKMNGEQPEGMDAATASLFPEKFVESELGLIPEGWDAGTVGSVTAAKGGYAFKSKQFVDEGNPVIKIKNITSAGTVTTSDCQCVDDDIAKTASRFKLSDGDLLMAMTGATVGKSGIYVSDGRDGYLNQRVARFESKVDSTQPCWFTYNLVNKDSIFEQIVGAAQGSAQPNISSKGIEQVKTVIPTFDLISKYQELVAPLYAKWISNFRENSQLSELRDTLLPKLLSGEIELGEQS
ncbi:MULTISPECIES: restriction endonuclease subunit S [unclassified Vibrio]|uniref:restriction endonuclease subunit S n=1 Tax=unclassified Vibrio TaxID=2614977 RepID=UPI0029645B37|nr:MULTISPECIES: restriction endonuclease subunit S [unclassified Vibrio]EJA7361040.1 restriction endonuclease subunit S [Vibrio alginolyticus]MDW2100515.1 restriction endonuclease subunit S [Vibrio sp. 1580]MDW2275596.1 restriction endonuclease subunit S [Vibrio sp. 1074]MDW2287416.1 restriction endonuclease subunit S [Vibrio sp. 1562]